MITNKTILVCDDDEGILDMMEIILEGSGYNIIPLKNSLKIYEIIEQEHPDLLLLDLWMPVLSGDQIVRRLRSDPQTRKLPVIIISASRDGKQISEESGANDYMAKPFDLDLLLKKIDEQFN